MKGSQLYTSLTRLKIAMNDGELPAMTAIPAEAQDYIDPRFTIGMGALEEDETRGLRCPIRGCGKYFQLLTQHINQMHPELGAEGLKQLLNIPPRTPLASERWLARRAEAAREWAHTERGEETLRLARENMPLNWRFDCRQHPKYARVSVMRSAGRRNLMDRCEAQISHQLIDLQNELGRSPSQDEAVAAYGKAFVSYARGVYGSWNAAKARFGLEVWRNQYQRRGVLARNEVAKDAVIEALKAYYERHGTLPNAKHAERPARTPLIPKRSTIQRAMGTERWSEAMRRVASILNIYGGRYGLPERAEMESVA